VHKQEKMKEVESEVQRERQSHAVKKQMNLEVRLNHLHVSFSSGFLVYSAPCGLFPLH
jgi:hypothetical protein